MKTTSESTCIEALNELLRGELAAVAAYERSVAEVRGPGTETLERILDEHRQNVSRLHRIVVDLGGQPSGGRPADVGIGTAGAVPVGALRAFEERQLAGYQAAVRDARLSEDCKPMIETEFIARMREHLRMFDEMEGRGGEAG